MTTGHWVICGTQPKIWALQMPGQLHMKPGWVGVRHTQYQILIFIYNLDILEKLLKLQVSVLPSIEL